MDQLRDQWRSEQTGIRIKVEDVVELEEFIGKED